MKRQKKNDSGITLVALVVSIIVMLVLAGVSLNATIGDNGIVTRAQEASRLAKENEEFEALQFEVTNYSVKALTSVSENARNIIDKLLEKQLIDSAEGVTDDNNRYIDYTEYEDENGRSYFLVKKSDNQYRIFENIDGTFNVDKMPLVGGGYISNGVYVVDANVFKNNFDSNDENDIGKFTIDGAAKLIFKEPIGVGEDYTISNGDQLSIYVTSTGNAKIYFYDDKEKRGTDGKTHYILTNEGLSRSAIDIEEGGILELVIGENVVVDVDSGYGKVGEVGKTVGKRSDGGGGGYAGIHVPATLEYDLDGNVSLYKYAILKIKGDGILKAYGGSAGNGGGSITGNQGGGGGGGAGAGIGGNGGDGGDGNEGLVYPTVAFGAGIGNCGFSGKNGEDCGKIEVYNSVEIYAYGGNGGSSLSNKSNVSSGDGGGGYPAAGIGGGGAGGGGGDHWSGGGGYSGGYGESETLNVYNGLGGDGSNGQGGAGYFEAGKSKNVGSIMPNVMSIGGQGGTINTKSSAHVIDFAGDGGKARKRWKYKSFF